MEKSQVDFRKKSLQLLDISYPLATGPNAHKSLFGRVLEGVFRKDYLTLQTSITLANLAEEDPSLRTVYSGSILDLSRRILEDMVYMFYIEKKGKEAYSRQFIQFDAVEQKEDMDFLLSAGVEIEPEEIKRINDSYDAIPAKLKNGRHNWAGQSVEQVVAWLVQEKVIPKTEMQTLFKMYIAGNRKNHTSPSDILGHLAQITLNGYAELDLHMGIMVSYGACLKIALLLSNEVETTEEVKNGLQELWKEVGGKIA